MYEKSLVSSPSPSQKNIIPTIYKSRQTPMNTIILKVEKKFDDIEELEEAECQCCGMKEECSRVKKLRITLP